MPGDPARAPVFPGARPRRVLRVVAHDFSSVLRLSVALDDRAVVGVDDDDPIAEGFGAGSGEGRRLAGADLRLRGITDGRMPERSRGPHPTEPEVTEARLGERSDSSNTILPVPVAGRTC